MTMTKFPDRSHMIKSLKRIGNAVVWICLAVGLPGAISTLTAEPVEPTLAAGPHNSEKCAVCRHYRTLPPVRSQINDKDMILVSPGHPCFTSRLISEPVVASDDDEAFTE